MYNLDEICRICLKKSSERVNLDEPIAELSNRTTYQALLSELLSGSITSDLNSNYYELLPQRICLSCGAEMFQCYRFRKKILSSEKILLNQLQKQHQLQEVDVAMDIESLENSIIVVGNVVKVNTSEIGGCNMSCSQCSVTDCAKRTTEQSAVLNNNVDSCRFCGANKSFCAICTVEEDKTGDITTGDIFEVTSISSEDTKVETFRCAECQKDFATKSRLKKHILTHSPDKPWHCKSCKWSFATETELNTHNLVNHLSEGRNECVYCNKAFKEKRLLRQHMITHKIAKRFHCQFCDKGFNLLHHLKNHEKIHENKSEFECEICKKRFITKDRLSSHVKTHQEKTYRCETCGKAFVSEASLEAHAGTHKKDDELLICSECGLQFTDSAKFNRHRRLQCIKTVKLGLNTGLKVICLVCSVGFEGEQAMKEHMKSHTNQFICSTCNKSFMKEASLKTHMKTHTLRAYNCDFCDESFSRSDHVKNHIARKHPTECSIDNRHECLVCNKKFVQTGELNIHMRTHTKIKPYSCGVCGKSFAQSNQLKSHERLHYNERPFMCNVCFQTYTTSSGLNQHLASHTAVLDIKNNDQMSQLLFQVESPISGSLSPISGTDFY